MRKRAYSTEISFQACVSQVKHLYRKSNKNGVFILNQNEHQEIWSNAPATAWAWERYPNQKCVWHCRENHRSFTRKAPNIDPQRTFSMRDYDNQVESDQSKQALKKQLKDLNIVLA